MLYDEAITYLQNLTKFGMNFGLGRITELMKRLDNPHLHLKVIHVGGTNGKGTTTAFIAAMLQQAGLRVGTFTSPHLHDYTERYCINGQAISQEDVAQIITYLQPHLDAMVKDGFEHPTEFEVGTALAFCYFHRQKVDYVVLEVGLGGAIDSTNVVQPQITVLTNVSMDHMDYLGDTLEEITQVKAGIIKHQVPVITASADPVVLAVIQDHCRQKKAPLTHVGDQVQWQRGAHDTKGQYFHYQGHRWQFNDLWIPLMGEHQIINAATALAVLEILADQGADINPALLPQALAHTIWPGRLELLGQNPTVLIDCAHNYAGAKSLRSALDEYWPGQQLVMVLGMLGDKERAKVMAELAPRAKHIVITKPNNPRAGQWQQIASLARQYVEQVEVVEDIDAAVAAGIAAAAPTDLVCITGSIYMVADARAALLRPRGLAAAR